MGIVKAAEMSADIVGVCSKSVRTWTTDFGYLYKFSKTDFPEAAKQCPVDEDFIQNLMSSKLAGDALNVKSMNVSLGGKQAKLRDTVWQVHL